MCDGWQGPKPKGAAAEVRLADGTVDFGAIGEAIHGGVTSIITTAGASARKRCCAGSIRPTA